MKKITVVGTGRMGSAMVRKLTEAQLPVHIWNRSHDQAQSLAEETGATVHQQVSSAVSDADIVLSTLASGEVTEEILLSPSVREAMGPHTIVCDMGTSGISTAQALSQIYGARFVDSPVSGSVPAVLSGNLLVMASGDKESVDAITGPVSCFAKRIVFLGPAGMGQTMKLSLMLILYGLNSAMAEGLCLAAESGIPLERAYEILTESSISSPYIQYKQQAFLSENEPVAMAMNLVAKDLNLINELAQSRELDLSLLTSISTEVNAARHAGFGSSDMADLLFFVRGQEAPARP